MITRALSRLSIAWVSSIEVDACGIRNRYHLSYQNHTNFGFQGNSVSERARKLVKLPSMIEAQHVRMNGPKTRTLRPKPLPEELSQDGTRRR